ncbi:MAG: hypothetical protein CMQ24_03440 [Gammaproteobacteria bacterium]|nr:hypothetical protein [Gammaproteobacteria bacterium]
MGVILIDKRGKRKPPVRPRQPDPACRAHGYRQRLPVPGTCATLPHRLQPGTDLASFLAFCGSVRAASFNQRVLDVFCDAVEAAGGDVTRISLRDVAAPLYDGDLEDESGLPAGIERLRRAIAAHDGLIIGCPEYNGYMTPVLLNALNWATRSAEATPDLGPFRNKLTVITSTSPGALGGMRASRELRTFLSGIGALVLPQAFSVRSAFSAFDDAGALTDERATVQAASIAGELIDMAERLG